MRFAIPKRLARKIKFAFFFSFSGRTFGLGARGVHRRPGAGWLDSIASDSNRILWRSTNPQRFGPQLGIRPVLDQSEAMGSPGV
jgi:hypothetical protein